MLLSTRMRLALSFIRSVLHSQQAYRLDFWVRSLSVLITAYAASSVWHYLYQQKPNAFGITLTQMITYSVLSALLSPVIGAADEVQWYISERVRQGTLELDLLKPIHFIRHMLFLNLGEGVLQLTLRFALGYVLGLVLLSMAAPASLLFALSSILSIALGYLVNFYINLLLGMLAIVMTSIRGFAWTFESVIRFASGEIVPLWIFPAPLAAVLQALPFHAIYFAPLSLYIGAGDPLQTLATQGLWLGFLAILASLIWKRLRYRLLVQGG